MTGLSNYYSQAVLANMMGKTAMPPMRQAYVAMFSAAGTDDGVGFTEFAGGGYQRVTTAGTDWATPSGMAPSIISNVNPLVFPLSTAIWGTAIAFGIFDALTAGNLMGWDYFGGYPWLPCTISAASPMVITSPRHGYLNGDIVVFSNEYGGSPPTFSQGSLTGPLTVTNSLTDTFQISNAGTIVNTTTSGDGAVRKVASQQFIANIQATFPASSLTVSLA